MIRLLTFSVLIGLSLGFSLKFDFRKSLKGLLSDDKESDKFEQFAKKWGKDYKTLDGLKRRAQTWKKNMAEIEEKNKNKEANGFELGENFFTDMNENERSKYLMDGDTFDMTNKELKRTARRAKRGAEVPYVDSTVDWRGPFMPPIRDQGSCGSCYAFAVINAIEVQWNSLGNAFSEFSEQQIVDCLKLSSGVGGCNGGYLHTTLNYSLFAGNAPRTDYPYMTQLGECKNDTETRDILKGYYNVYLVSDMEYYVYYKGPLAFGFSVGQSFFSYKSGIFNLPIESCSRAWGTSLGGHAMSMVGFGVEKGVPYWIARNQWGADWGEGGYIRMRRGTNVCGIESDVYLPWVHGQTGEV